MIVYKHIKSGKIVPEWGCWGSLEIKNGVVKKVFIRGEGHRTAKKNEFERMEIPDLPKDYTDDQWREYALKWGTEVAQEFLHCADIVKPTYAHRMFHPTKNRETWDNPEIQAWFESTFKTRLWNCIDGYALGLGNICTIDVLKFEQVLYRQWHYPKDHDGSMHDFMVKTFGEENTRKWQELFLPESLCSPTA